MMDDPALEGFNVGERVDTFVQRAMERFAWTRGNDIMLTMGSDFHYGNAFHWYKVGTRVLTGARLWQSRSLCKSMLSTTIRPMLISPFV